MPKWYEGEIDKLIREAGGQERGKESVRGGSFKFIEKSLFL